MSACTPPAAPVIPPSGCKCDEIEPLGRARDNGARVTGDPVDLRASRRAAWEAAREPALMAVSAEFSSTATIRLAPCATATHTSMPPPAPSTSTRTRPPEGVGDGSRNQWTISIAESRCRSRPSASLRPRSRRRRRALSAEETLPRTPARAPARDGTRVRARPPPTPAGSYARPRVGHRGRLRLAEVPCMARRSRATAAEARRALRASAPRPASCRTDRVPPHEAATAAPSAATSAGIASAREGCAIHSKPTATSAPMPDPRKLAP